MKMKPNYYKGLLNSYPDMPSPFENQIDIVIIK